METMIWKDFSPGSPFVCCYHSFSRTQRLTGHQQVEITWEQGTGNYMTYCSLEYLGYIVTIMHLRDQHTMTLLCDVCPQVFSLCLRYFRGPKCSIREGNERWTRNIIIIRLLAQNLTNLICWGLQCSCAVAMSFMKKVSFLIYLMFLILLHTWAL